MRNPHSLAKTLRLFGPVIALCGAVAATNAATLLNDTWADASRDEQNLPTESQWFSSGGTANLTNVAAGSMTFISEPASSRSAITYFATNGLPVSLADGQTIKATVDFKVTGVSDGFSHDAQSMRFGLFDYSAGTRVVADEDVGGAGLNGANVTGYGFFTLVSDIFGDAVLWIRERTAVTGGDLLGSTSSYTNSLAQGFDLSLGGFAAGPTYTMTFSVTRDGSSAVVTNKLTGGGLDITAVGTNSPGWFRFDAFAWRNSGADETAETFVFSNMQVEGPYGSANPPYIAGDPQDQLVSVGQTLQLQVSAGGGMPLSYQWYSDTSGGTTNPVAGATNSAFTIASATTNDTGNYFVIVTNTLGAATSDVAAVTVNVPTPTPPGVVMDDTWADGSRTNLPINATNSLWLSSATASLVALPGSMLAIPRSGGSELWVGYFTEDTVPASPVYLDVGSAIQASLTFTMTNIVNPDDEHNGLRVGLFNFVGGPRLEWVDEVEDFTASEGNGTGVRGYYADITIETNFTDDSVMSFRVRSSLESANLMGSSGDYTGLGGGPTGYAGLPGFQEGTEYTLNFIVYRINANSVVMRVQITDGASLNIVHDQLDDSAFLSYQFDTIGIRPQSSFRTADYINFTEFKVEVLGTAPIPVDFEITAFDSGGTDAVAITWDSIPGRTYEVVSTPDLTGTVNWTTNAIIVATESSTTYTNSGLTATELLYGVADVLE